MRIQLSDHFTYGRLFRFVLPSIVMMIFVSIYGVMDGLFVSNYVGKTPFAAINIIVPLLMGMGAVGTMIGSGGAALVSKTLGEGKREEANRLFSMLVYLTIFLGVVLTILGLWLVRPASILMGATGDLLEYCVLYGRIMISLQTAFMLQLVFQSMSPVAEKPKFGLTVTVIAGSIDILLNALFIIVLGWGLAGAAISSVIGQVIGAVVPIVYYARQNDSLLRLVRPTFPVRAIVKVCTNGMSELMTTLSSSFVSVLYNLQLIRLAGEDGVAAYGVILYVNYIFFAVFLGYSLGVAPVIGYNHGAENHAELKNLFRKSLRVVGLSSVALTLLAVTLAGPIAWIYVRYDAALFELSRRAFFIYAFSFLLCGFNIFASAFFTALNNGFISATLSFSRTLLFQTLVIFTLPALLGTDGVWLSVPAAELLALLVTAFFFFAMRKRYHYA